MPDIVPVTTRRLLKEFVELPYALYAGHPRWVPPLRRDEYRRLSAAHNPFLDHADIELRLARTQGKTTGRVAIIRDRLHDEVHHERTAWFGFFEAQDQASAAVLLAEAECVAASGGARVIRGPANPSLNESAGLLIDAFDEDPFVLMPYNGPEYVRFIEDAGYVKAKDLFAWSLDMSMPLGERITRIAERVARRNHVKIRTVDLKHFDRDLENLKTIYRAAWADNWGFVPPTDAEIEHLATDLRPILDPEIVLFAEIDDRVVACGVAIPDVNQVLKKMGGRLTPLSLLHFLRRRSVITQARMILLGVLPELRKTGLYALLVSEVHRRGLKSGYRRGELSWTLENNHEINAGIEAMGGRKSKTYRLYEKNLSTGNGVKE